MRVLHFSDIHIGVESYGKPDPETGLSSRLLDFLAAFDQIVEYALANSVDLVVFAGDAYKNRDPSQTHQREFAKRVIRLAGQMPVFLLAGNHDLPPASYRASAVEIFGTMGVPNVTVADRLATHVIQTGDGPVHLVGLPWVRRADFLARDDARRLSIDQLNQLLEQKLSDLLSFEASKLDKAIPSILVGHLSLNTARWGSERTMTLGHDHVLLQSHIASLPFDYVALGHIHKRQQLWENPPIVYPGSVQRVDFGEEDEPEKGFCTIDIDPSRPLGSRIERVDFHPVDARQFMTIKVDVQPGDPSPTDTVLRAIARRHVAGAIVRVLIDLPPGMDAQVRERDVRQALEEQGVNFIASISKNVQSERRTRLHVDSIEQASPEDLLKAFLQSKNTPSDRAGKLIGHGKRLIRQLQQES